MTRVIPELLVYKLRVVPDRSYGRHQLAAGGDPAAAMWDGLEHTCRVIEGTSSGKLSVTFRYVVEPMEKVRRPKDRLKIYVLVRATTRRAAKIAQRIIESGPISRFFLLDRSDEPSFSMEHVQAARFLTRRARYLAPATDRDLNPNIPDRYFDIEPFVAREDNDCLSLDRLVSVLDEHAFVDIGVTPYDADPERTAHGRYLSLLNKVTRSRYQRDEAPVVNYLDDDLGHTDRSDRFRYDYHEDPVADVVLRGQRKFHETLLKPHLLFTIRVLAESEDSAALIAATLGESAFEDGSYSIRALPRDHPLFAKAIREAKAADVTGESWELDDARESYSSFRRLPSIATVDELKGVFRLPIAGYAPTLCFRKDTDPPAMPEDDSILLGYERAFGLGGGTCAEPQGLAIRALPRHVLTTGVTGSGKTTGNVGMVLQLVQAGVPVLIIESSKTEFRFLATLDNHSDPAIREFASNLEVYTVGEESVSPLCINGFESLPGVSLDERIARLRACFDGALALGAPLPEILFEAIEEVLYAAPGPDAPPTMKDLHGAVCRILARKSYSGELGGNLRAALETRINTLCKGMMGRVFQCRHSVPGVERFFQKSCLVELDLLPPEEKSLYFNFLNEKIREFLRKMTWTGPLPRLVLLVEEAQQLIGGSTDARPSETTSDPRAYAAKRMAENLRELRGLGAGIILSTQHPSLLPSEVRKSMCTKLAYRQDDAEERTILAGAMGMSAWEMDELPLLNSGEYFLMTEGLVKPTRVAGTNIVETLDA